MTSAAVCVGKTVELDVRIEKCDAQRSRWLPRDFDRGVRAREPHVRGGSYLDPRCVDALSQQVVTRLGFERAQRLQAGLVSRGIERSFDRASADRATTGQSDAVRGQHARERMQQDFVGAEQFRNRAGMLPRGAAKSEEAEACRVFAVVQRQLPDRIRHARAGNLQERFGQRLDAVLESRFVAGRGGQFGESRA